MAIRNLEVPHYWNTKEPKRDKRIADVIFKGAGSPEEISAAWYRYLHDRVKFPFYGYIMTPDSTPTATKYSRVHFVKFAPPDRCQGDHIVLIGGATVNIDRWDYYFLCDLQKMETDTSSCDALLDYLYWIKYLKTGR
jgi:hypothetical protein